MKFFELKEGFLYQRIDAGLMYKVVEDCIYFLNPSNYTWTKSVLSPMELYECEFEGLKEIELRKQFEHFANGWVVKDRFNDALKVSIGVDYDNIKEALRDDCIGLTIYDVDNEDICMGINISFGQFEALSEFVESMKNFMNKVRE